MIKLFDDINENCNLVEITFGDFLPYGGNCNIPETSIQKIKKVLPAACSTRNLIVYNFEEKYMVVNSDNKLARYFIRNMPINALVLGAVVCNFSNVESLEETCFPLVDKYNFINNICITEYKIGKMLINISNVNNKFNTISIVFRPEKADINNVEFHNILQKYYELISSITTNV